MSSFNPQYTISPLLLVAIKRITVLIHELNRQAAADLEWGNQSNKRGGNEYGMANGAKISLSGGLY